MEIVQMTEHQRKLLTDAGGYVEMIVDLVAVYKPCRQTSIILERLDEALMWINQLCMVGELNQDTKKSTDSIN